MKELLEELLKNKGYKITKQRKLILTAFLNSHKHLLTAQEVHHIISEDDNTVNFSTVYRNLEILSQIGIVKRINLDNGVNSYELNIDNKHHHHLICKKCGETETISYCPMEEINKNIRKISQFTPIEHKIEIYGYCGSCKDTTQNKFTLDK
ncbi:MAG: transcriptional repressor [Clostridiaceae bacterium]|nr:transcriptional repressor [Clostridiaceae bacterium]